MKRKLGLSYYSGYYGSTSLGPRPHVYVFMRKWRLFCSFSPSVYTQTLIQRFRKSPFSPETETFENGFESGDFRKRRLSKTLRCRVDVAF